MELEQNNDDFKRLIFFEHQRKDAEAAYALNPLDADNLSKWGGSLLELSMFQKGPYSLKYQEDALAKLEEALEIDPKKHQTLWLLGNAYINKTFSIPENEIAKVFFEKAAQCFQQAYNEDPENERYKKSMQDIDRVPAIHMEYHKELAIQQARQADAAPSSASIPKANKIVAELEKIRKELEDNKKSVKESQHRLGYTQFEFEEVKRATHGFAESFKIGQGGFSVIYKGILNNKEVAIKKLKDNMDEKGFNEEIETLSKVRHPNIITLIGACHDKVNPVLVYEYLPKGSLEDHLSCKNDTRPLSSQARIRIALEICSALSFLHSIPRAHGDLKPDNILLNSNYTSKLSDFGTARELIYTNNTITPYYLTTNVKGTFAYMDLDHLSGRLTPQSDMYAFGMVLLRLATGKDVSVDTETGMIGLRELVDIALEENTFDNLVDIGWPSKEAPKKMAELAFKCFEKKRKRPNATQVFKSLTDISSIID